MNIAVRYYSRGGNTKKVAEAIAKAVGAEANDSSTPLTQAVDLLFLGGSVYGFGLDDNIKDYIAKLDPALIKKVALFGTSARVKSGNPAMTKLLQEKGISVLKEDFYCRGEFKFVNKGRPNDSDLKKAAEFALATIKG